MSVISAAFIHKIATAAAAEGLSRAALLTACGVDPGQPIDPLQMVASDAHYSMWERIVRELDSPGFPLRYARTMSPDDYGAFGLALKTAPTMRAAMLRAQRYLVVLTNTSWLDTSELESTGRVLFRREGARRLGMRCANEAAIAELVGTTRTISGINYIPQSVTFKHPAPRCTEEHERFFNCPVHFDRDVDSVVLDASILDLPLPKADDGLSQFLINHLDKLVTEHGAAMPLEQSLRALISDALPDGSPNMLDIARRLGMSRRTLARRLAEVGTTFQQLGEDTRRELAEQLLSQTRHSLAEVGFLLGFSEQSAFQRAFKRWTGQTPAAFRLGPA